MPKKLRQFAPPQFDLIKTSSAAVTYHLRPKPNSPGGADVFGWALATVNDVTGELAIQSDRGNWSHRWNTAHLGAPSLTAFIGDRDAGHCDYLAGKLSPRRESQKFSAEATVEHLQEVLCAHRLEEGRTWIEYYRDEDPEDVPENLLAGDGPRWANAREVRIGYHAEKWPLTKMTARGIFNALSRLSHESDEREFNDRFYEIQGNEWTCSDSLYEMFRTEPDPSYVVLESGILPALVIACREASGGWTSRPLPPFGGITVRQL